MSPSSAGGSGVAPGWPARVLLVAPASTGGVGAHLRDLAEGLVRAGHRVVLAGPAPLARCPDPHRHVVVPHAVVTHLPVPVGRRVVADPSALLRLRRQAAAADVVHAHGWRAGAAAVLAARGAVRTPLVLTLHNPPPRAGPLTDLVARLVLARAGAVLAGTDDLAVLARRLGARQVRPAAIRPPDLPEPDGAAVRGVRAELAPAGQPLVMAIARLAPQKGLDVLLEAVAAATRREDGPAARPARDRPPAFTVAVAGEGPLRARLQRRIDRQRLPVTLLGHRDDVPALLAAADLVVCASRWEGPSLALQEALRRGRAVLATDVGGVADLVGDAALLVAGGDAASLAHGIQQLLGSDEQRMTLEHKALRRARDLPSQGDVVSATVAAYRAAAAAPRGRTSCGHPR